MNYTKRISDFSVTSYQFDPIDSRMYVITGNSETAIIVDPCVCEEALENVQKSGIKNVIMLLTHEHYDHISGVNWWRERLPATVICSKVCAERITDSKLNASRHFDILFLFAEEGVRKAVQEMECSSYVCSADIAFDEEYNLSWAEHTFVLTAVPGHSPGSACILLDGRYCFTGDSLIYGQGVITKLPGGNRADFDSIAKPYLKKLDDEVYVFPGHGDCFKIGDERTEDGEF